MASGYEPKDIEAKWQKAWEDEGVYRASDDARSSTSKVKSQKFYGLIEFPYPSGDGLHVGHPRSYTAIDIVARKRRMEGKNVLYPIGWDAFGLPTENYAIKHKVKPQDATAKNVANFTRQLKSLGFGFDWQREINTTDPKYYKWTQWMFLQFFKQGLAYKATSTINWCPKDKIGLANEEAQGGVCERCGTPVEKREKAQWMIAITKYADRLLEDLDTVDYLPKIKKQQQDWIGKKEGAYVDFVAEIPNSKFQIPNGKVTVFTTRPDTIFGATFLVVSPEVAKKWLEVGWQASEEVHIYVENALKRDDIERTSEGKEKNGVDAGIQAINPATNEKIPVWIADYVLGNYGTGAIMAVPAHDERDGEFAKKFGLPVKQVVASYVRMSGVATPRNEKKTITRNVTTAIIKRAGEEKYLLLLQSNGECGFVGGGIEDAETAREAIVREIKEETGFTDVRIISDDFPVVCGHGYKSKKDVNCLDPDTIFVAEIVGDDRVPLSDEDQNAHEVVWVSDKDVSKKLTKDHHRFMWDWYRGDKVCFSDDGIVIHSGFLDGLQTAAAKEKVISWLEEKQIGKRAVTYKLRDWVFSRQRYWGEPIPIINCAKCGHVPVPESQLPVELPPVEAYEPTDTGESPLAAIREWVEVDCPKCGGKAERETDTMPNWAGSSWYFLRYCDPHNDKAFADAKKLKYWMPVDLYNGGMEHTTLHLLYSRFWYKFLWDIGAVPKACGSEPYRARRSHGLILAEGGEKMSKSKGNVVNPDDIVNQYGADVFRVYEMFMGPFDQPVPWDTNGIEGVRRFLEKVWRLFEHLESSSLVARRSNLETLFNQTVKKVGEDIDALSFNTAVSALMILTNAFQDAGGVPEEMRSPFLKLLAPFAPHLAEELWRTAGNSSSIHRESWPTYDAAKLVSETFELVIQVNGKVRDRLVVPTDISEQDAIAKALASEKIQAALAGKEPQKTVYVKGRLVNIVA